MIHHSTPYLPRSAPLGRPLHPFKNRLIVRLELPEPRSILQFFLHQIQTRPCVFLWVVSPFSAVLDFAAAPFLGEPCETGL